MIDFKKQVAEAVAKALEMDVKEIEITLNDFDTATPVRGIHTVKVKPYSTLTYTVGVTTNTGSTVTYTYASYAWEQCATTATPRAESWHPHCE